MVEQLDLLSDQSKHEAALALIRRALIIAAEDGSYDQLSQDARRLISQALLPPPGGVEAIIAGLQSDLEWNRAAANASNKAAAKLAIIAAEIRRSNGMPAQRPRYNRAGHQVPDTEDDLAVIEGEFCVRQGKVVDDGQPDEQQEWQDYDPDC